MSYLNETYKELKSFLFNPEDTRYEAISGGEKFKKFSALFLFDMFISVVLLSGFSLLESAKLINPADNKINDLTNLYSPAVVALLAIVLLPLLEEVIFRFGLRFNKFIPAQILIFLTSKFKKIEREEIEQKYLDIWNRYYKAIFYSSSLVFAFYHINNYTLTTWVIVLSPLLVAPQFILGSLIAYLRVKFNFGWGYALHALHNAVFIVILLAATSYDTKITEYNCNNYQFKIETVSSMHDSSSISVTANLDTVKAKKANLTDVIAFVYGCENKNVELEYKGFASQKVNVSFISVSKSEQANRDTIIRKICEFYNCRIDVSYEDKPSFVLAIIDTTLLNYNLVNMPTNVSSRTVCNDDKFEATNASLKQIAQGLNSWLNEKVNCSDTLYKKYTFSFKDRSKVESNLRTLGLALNKSNEKIKKYTIRIK